MALSDLFSMVMVAHLSFSLKRLQLTDDGNAVVLHGGTLHGFLNWLLHYRPGNLKTPGEPQALHHTLLDDRAR